VHGTTFWKNLANAAAAKSSNPLITTNIKDAEMDPKAVEKIRKSIEERMDMSVCLLNYSMTK
jgi:hypothetical protein